MPATTPSCEVTPVVCHVSSAHNWFDERIFHKQCKSLARAGYDVRFVVPAEHAIEEDHVRIVPIPRSISICHRITIQLYRLLKLAWRQHAAIYHVHDPELLLVAAVLRLCGKTVIYDAHEDYEQKLRSRKLPPVLNLVLPKLWWAFEYCSALTLSHVITADRHTQNKFSLTWATTLGNFPPLTFANVERDSGRRNGPFRIVYIGGLTRARGLIQVLEALEYLQDLDIELHIAGDTGDELLRERFERPRVVYHGRIPWQRANSFLVDGDVGVALLQPTPGYRYCPGENIVKLWEYLAVGLPVVISDFPKLRELVERLECGVVADPTSPEAIADVIRKLYRDPAERHRLGENGRRAVHEECNWEKQERKLLDLYDRLS